MSGIIQFTPGEVAAYYQARVPQLKQRRAAEWRGACPIHHGKNENFAVEPATGRWFCHSSCGRGGDIIELEQELSGADFLGAKAEAFRLCGKVEWADGNGTHNGTPVQWRETARYQYEDASGKVLYEVIRRETGDGDQRKKRFIQFRKDQTGRTVWNLDGVKRVPFHLPRLLERAKHRLFIAEGEKDVVSLEAWGATATTNPGGSGSSRLFEQWAEYFKGRDVTLLPDNDAPGRRHAATVAAALLPVVHTLQVIELPGLNEGGDISDWRDAGGTADELKRLVRETPILDADGLAGLRARWGVDDKKANDTERAARAEAGSLVTRRVSDIIAKQVSWLWPGRIARGKVSIIAGNPGLGKSQVSASIAAIVTIGGHWPVDRSECEPGDVIILSAEDDPADTLRPRLEAAGANLHRVHVMDAVVLGYTGEGQQQNRAFSLQKDLEGLSVKLAELGNVAVVVIDPITAYLGLVDSHRNAEVRALLAPLSELAAKHDTAIIGVSHLNKSAGTEALMRVTGSLAFVAAARAAYLVAQDPENPTRRLFLPMKNNIGPDSSGLAFRIEGTTIQSAVGPLATSLVVWESEPVSTTADEVMRSQVPERGSALRDAENFLQGTLSGPTPAAEVSRMAADAGISEKTLRRASESLKIRKDKTGMKGGWEWSLPPKMPKIAEGAQQKSLGIFGEVGHLRESEAVVEVEL